LAKLASKSLPLACQSSVLRLFAHQPQLTIYWPLLLVLGIESSCDETGIALYDTATGLVGHALHSQVALHAEYGGVVPELASRDHIQRITPLVETVMTEGQRSLTEVDAIAYTAGPGLAGALLVGAGFATSLAYALNIPAIPVHHLEGHLLSPLLATPAPRFPFIALLVSGGHTQLMRVSGLGDYTLLGETVDDAAGEAYDKSAKVLGLGYPGGPAIAALAASGQPGRFKLPRPMLNTPNLDFSFSGLKTAVMLAARDLPPDTQARADLAAELQTAINAVLIAKAIRAVQSSGLQQLVVAGGVGANQQLRSQLNQAAQDIGCTVFYPPLEFCTDNGAMIALAGALRLSRGDSGVEALAGFSVHPRWDLSTLV
jgi:N6-L-threonylcarbamoyladenine synthase